MEYSRPLLSEKLIHNLIFKNMNLWNNFIYPSEKFSFENLQLQLECQFTFIEM